MLVFADVSPHLNRHIVTAMLAFVSLLYFTITESSSYQGSFGKVVTGMRVTTIDGAALTPMQALQRNALKFVSWLPFGAGFLMAALTVKKQALHDIVAKTLVVKR